jgi:Baseplate J-like protein
VIPLSAPPVDSRDANALLNQFLSRRIGYVPQWNPGPKSAGAAIGPIFSRFLAAILQRLNQAPAKDKLAFLDMLGLRLIPAQPARVPIVFQLSQGAADSSAPAGTRVAAPPPPGSSQQIVFETEQDAGVAAAKLVEVVSLWPGRDEYLDHSALFLAGQQFTLFDPLNLQQTDHILYLAHSSLLAFMGTVHLLVTFDLLQGSSSPLDLTWEYWDGQVWRGFISNPASCLNAVGAGLDGTSGLSTDGTVHLDVEGAQTAATTVNGVKSYWIRGRLSQPLPPDPAQLLPIVNSVNIRTLVDRRIELSPTVTFGNLASQTSITVQDECGQVLQSFASAPVTITIADASDSRVTPVTVAIPPSSSPANPTFTPGHTYQFTVGFQGLVGTVFVPFNSESASANSSLSVVVMIKVEGLMPDKAMCDGKTLDLTKAFFPLGASPNLGSTFYFKQNEIFSKPGAVVNVYLDPATPPSLTGSGSGSGTPIGHTVNWEYWNGWEWSLLAQSSTSNATPPVFSKEFTVNEIVQFTVPQDLRSTTVNNEEGLWMRARLVSGGYGIQQSIAIPSSTTVYYVQAQPPAVAVFRMGYSWTNGPAAFENVFTYNDFSYQDHSCDARQPGKSFSPYTPIAETTPALYLGFDAQLPVNNFGLYMDIVEQAGASTGPALVWEYWNGGGWEAAAIEDDTEALQLPGILNFIPAADSAALARFDRPLFWFRGRLKDDGDPTTTVISCIYTNAVWASQWDTFTNSPLGASTGAPNQILQFTQIPVLPGQVIEVEELSGPRANTEWRQVVLDVTSGDSGAVSELEAMLAAEGTQTDVILDTIRLTRDKNKLVTAVWVQWQEQLNFFDAASTSRCYVLDHASGRFFLGDGNAGMIPQAGAAIQAFSFRSGGGLAGNVSAATITQLLGSVSGVQSVSNPRAAEGGADGEMLQAFALRGPMSIRSRGAALSLSDYETMAREASAGVAVARAIPTCDPNGRTIPGWVTLIIIPQSQDPQPVPSFGLRDDVRVYLEGQASANLAAAHSIEVIGPTYLLVDVTATLAPQDPTQAGTVEQAALQALAQFLNPLHGGPGGLGWDLGRDVFASDVAVVLGDTPGVDYVAQVSLFVNGVLQGETVEVPAGQIVAAGQLKVSLILPVGG